MTLIVLIVARRACPAASRRKMSACTHWRDPGSDALLHLTVSSVWQTDCDRCCLARVSPSLLSVPCHIWRQIGRRDVWRAARWLSQWARVMDEAEQDAASSLPAPLVSVPAHWGALHPLHLSNHSETALSPPRAPQWGKWWPKRTRINRRHTKASVPDTWCGGRQSRSDGLMMYLQTVWQRKSVTAGTEAHVTSSAGREKTDWSDVVFVICRELSDHKWTAVSPSVHTWR